MIMAIAYLCLGSNLGNRADLIEKAVSLLGLCENIKIVRTSALYETEPWGVKNQNWFLNLAVEIKTTLSPEQLLAKCNEIEKRLGRNRELEQRWGQRTLDIDIIFYDKDIINCDNLKIPHQNMHQRAFVLVPLLELIPDFVHPIMNKTISDLYEDLEDVEEIFLYGTRINEQN